jgi:hypothetical protein
MQHLVDAIAEGKTFLSGRSTFQAQVRFLAYHRIKPHVPPLVRAPVNSFEFHSCERTPQVDYLTLSLRPRTVYRKHRVFIVYCVDYQGI